MTKLEAIGNTTGIDTGSQITAVGTAGDYVVTFYGQDSTGDYSIFVQKFNADGTASGAAVQLEAIGNASGADTIPQITAVGTAGDYVVTFQGVDAGGDSSIFVQKFNANGTVSGAMVQLEAIGKTTTNDSAAQITAIGTTGEYVVTFTTADSIGAVYVQKFNANGTVAGAMVQLESIGSTATYAVAPQISAVGTAGDYVVIFAGQDSTYGFSTFVQKFNADGTKSGAEVQLATFSGGGYSDTPAQITAVGASGEYVVVVADRQYADGSNYSIFVQKFNADGTVAGAIVKMGVIDYSGGNPQITAVGTTGEYVVVFQGIDASGDTSIYIQKFNANGTVAGASVVLEAIGNTTGADLNPQITAVGTAGEYAVTFSGKESSGDSSIFVQKFNADGTVAGAEVKLEAIGNTTGDDTAPQITAVGTSGEYIVSFTGIDSNGDASIFVQKFNADGTVAGNVGVTTITGTAGNDTLVGDANDNILNGLAGDDSLDGAAGADTMNGGSGNDTYFVDNVGDSVVENAAEGIDTVNSSIDYTLSDNVENLILSATAIRATGNALDNTLTGNGSNNTIDGGAGADTISGGAGNDVLNGGLGNDTLTGGTGLDTFVFNTALSTTTNKDTITDFSHTDDTIQLENAIFTKLTTTGTIASSNFYASDTGTAHDSNDYIVYNNKTGVLSYDADGNGAGAAVQITVLGATTHPTNITYTDFVII